MGFTSASHEPIFLPPTVGPAPAPPKALWDALRLLDRPIADQMGMMSNNRASRAGDPVISAINGLLDLREELRDLTEDFGGKWMTDVFVRTMSAIPVVKRARAVGLMPSEASEWVESARAIVGIANQACIASYVRACRDWEVRIDRNIGSMAADPDWDMGSAQRVKPSAPEAFLARSLENAGIPMHSQVGISRHGGRRQGGWFHAFWLDCAHRDIAFLLRIDVELDGMAHRSREAAARDTDRNDLLRERGWYILRVDSRSLGREQHNRAVRQVLTLVKRHRRAIVLGRTNFHDLSGDTANSTV